MKLVNIGFGNMVCAERVVSVISPDSAPIKRIVQEAKEEKRLIDATQGRKTKAVIFTDSDHIVLSYLTAERLKERFTENVEGEDYE